jgi:hypothetical protein
MLFWKKINVNCENHIKHKDTLFAENAELLHANEGGIDIIHSILTFIPYQCGYLNFSTRFMKNVSIISTEKHKIMKSTPFCGK